MAVDQHDPATPRDRPDNQRRARGAAPASPEQLARMLDRALPDERRAAIVAQLGGAPTSSSPPAVTAPTVLPPEAPGRIGRYLVVRRLGAGGMGVVYEAEDPHLDRRIAIKVVRPDQLDREARARLLREARALAKISHPNVVTVHDVGEHGDQVFVATELVDGETMATWQRGRDWRALVDAWSQVARGLAAVHAGGIVHRDVKPSNVFVGRDGRVRIGDFGLARGEAAGATEPAAPAILSVGRLTRTGAVAGTPGYMAPEQLRGAVDARSDQFALCVAIVEGLTGARPVAGQTSAIPSVLPALRAVLERGLEVDPAARYTSMIELADALVRALEQPQPGAVLRPERRPLAWRWFALAAVLFGGVAGVLSFAAGERSGATASAMAAASTQAQQRSERQSVLERPERAQAQEPTERVTPRDAITGRNATGAEAVRPVERAAGNRPRRPAVHGGASPEVLPEQAATPAKQAGALEAAGRSAQVRAIHQQVDEVIYHQALAAFQVRAYIEAEQLAKTAANYPKVRDRALLLYGDTIFQQGDIRRAKAFFSALRKQLTGDDRAIATGKIIACNRALKLPELEGVHD